MTKISFHHQKAATSLLLPHASLKQKSSIAEELTRAHARLFYRFFIQTSSGKGGRLFQKRQKRIMKQAHTPPTVLHWGSFQCSSCWTTKAFDAKDGPVDLRLLQDICVCENEYTSVVVCDALHERVDIVKINRQLFVLHLVHVSILLGALTG